MPTQNAAKKIAAFLYQLNIFIESASEFNVPNVVNESDNV
ncbi:MAG: hypothetical protein ACI9LX_001126 [Paraglaciecola sp.]|jgi:hypothetical protein